MLDGTGSPWREILTQLGIDPTTAVAGFSGGIVNVLRMKALTAILVVANLVSGTLVAVYLAEPVSKLVNFPLIPTSFVVGYIGVQILEYISSLLRQRLSSSAPKNGGQKDGPS